MCNRESVSACPGVDVKGRRETVPSRETLRVKELDIGKSSAEDPGEISGAWFWRLRLA